MANVYTLTRILVDVTKTSAKMAFAFFFVASILLVVTLNEADPDFNQQRVEENTVTQIGTFTTNTNQQRQLVVFILNDYGNVKIFRVVIEELADNGNAIRTVVNISTSDEAIFKEVDYSSGSYRISASYEVGNNYIDNDIEVGILVAQINWVLFGLTIIFLIIFGISVGLFWSVLPFTIFALIFQSVSGQAKPVTVPSEKVKQKNSKKSIRRTSYTQQRMPVLFNEDSFFSKLTKKEWWLLSFAFLSFIGFIFEPGGPFLFFAIILTAISIYSVSEREKTKNRILVLLKNYPHTNVRFLAAQLDKKQKYIIEVLQILILDDALPIRLDLATSEVKLVGEIDGDVSPIVSPVPHTEIQQTDVVQALQQSTPTPPMKEGTTHHCTTCGEELQAKAKYCYSCGTKQ